MGTARRCLHGLMLVVFVVSIAPIAVVAADDKRDTQCREFAASVADDGYAPADIEVLSGCDRDANGSWFWLTDTTDARLVKPRPLTPDEREQTKAVRGRIARESYGLLSTLRATYDATNTAANAYPNLLVALNLYSMGAISGRWGLKPEMGDGLGTKGVYAVYEPILVDYLTDPNNVDLANFVAWWVARRVATIPANVQEMNPLAKTGYIEAMAFYRGPWPWELQRDYSMEMYLDWALANGRIPVETAPTPTPVPTSANATNACADRAFWMGATVERYWNANALIFSLGPAQIPDPDVADALQRGADALLKIANDQKASNPPTAMLALNALLVEAIRGYADANALLTDAFRTGDQTTYDQGWKARDEPQRSWGEAGIQLEGLEKECGRSFHP